MAKRRPPPTPATTEDLVDLAQRWQAAKDLTQQLHDELMAKMPSDSIVQLPTGTVTKRSYEGRQSLDMQKVKTFLSEAALARCYKYGNPYTCLWFRKTPKGRKKAAGETKDD